MAKLAHAELPKMARGNRKSLDPAKLKELVADIDGSLDFAPHVATDGDTYATYKEAQSVATIAKREVADSLGIERNMIRQRIWNTDGDNDREKKGKWIFALTQRSKPPAPRAAKQDGEAQAA